MSATRAPIFFTVVGATSGAESATEEAGSHAKEPMTTRLRSARLERRSVGTISLLSAISGGDETAPGPAFATVQRHRFRGALRPSPGPVRTLRLRVRGGGRTNGIAFAQGAAGLKLFRGMDDGCGFAGNDRPRFGIVAVSGLLRDGAAGWRLEPLGRNDAESSALCLGRDGFGVGPVACRGVGAVRAALAAPGGHVLA
jgi:hypothetical protein